MSNIIQELEQRGHIATLHDNNIRLEAGLIGEILARSLGLPDLKKIPPTHHHRIGPTLENHALLFDLDDTLVDTSRSYDAAVEQMTGCTHQELQSLRSEGGFNDDWTAATELLRRANRPRPLQDIIQEGKRLYASLARTNETPYFRTEWLQNWQKRHRLFIFTGRTRDEYEDIWGERLNPYFTEVLCLGEHGFPGKPAPDGLLYLIEKHALQGGLYIGNSVDDMRAAKAAGLQAVGITTNQSEETLRKAGADHIIAHLDEL